MARTAAGLQPASGPPCAAGVPAGEGALMAVAVGPASERGCSHMQPRGTARLQQVRLTETGKAIFPLLHQFFSCSSQLSEMWGLEVFPDSSATLSF